MISLKTIVNGWNRFFFEPISPVPVAVYRILLGVLLLANFLLMLPDVEVWFTETGSLPRETALKVSGGNGLQVLNLLPQTDASVWLLYVVAIAASASLAAGFFTRTSAILAFLCLASFCHRNPMTLNSGDSFLRIATFFMIFTPAGTALSIDRWLKVRRGRARGEPEAREPWAQRLIQLQLAFLYLYAFVSKTMGPMWLDGTAVYYTTRLTEFWRFPVPYVYEHMWTIKLWTWGTLVIEFALGVLVWIKEFRYWVLLGGVLLHLGIDYSMNIPLFGPIMMAAYITHLEEKDLQRFFAWCKSLARKGPRTQATPAPAPGRVASAKK